MGRSNHPLDSLALPSYGGQAVIEGVMMRGALSCAVAMRAPSREIVIHTEPLGAIYKSRIKKVPFVRGLVMLWDGLGLGMRALTLSANTQSGDDEQITGLKLYATITLSLGFAIGLFFLLPAAIAHLCESAFGWSLWWGNVTEGVMRLSLLVAYLYAVGFMANTAPSSRRRGSRRLSSPLVRGMIRPNLALQRLTTRRPSADMLEVAIAAFEAMRADERQAPQVW